MNKSTNAKGFGSKLGFILATAGSAVGLGNVWRFPYLVGKYGGGAFVIVFLLSVLLIGTVVMIAETFLGKRTRTTVVGAYAKVNPWLKWVGLLCVIVPFIISTYYALIGGWSTGYAFNYLFNSNIVQSTATAIGSDAFFASMSKTSLTPIFYTILFLGTALVVVCMGVQKGIEKVSKILMPTLLVLLVVVVIKSLTLGEGVVEGLQFYIGKFDFKALGFDGVVAAMGQAFYSLSLGMGIIIAYGSYAGKKVNIVRSTIAVCSIDTLVALLAGFAIFPAIFALSPNSQEMAMQAGPKLLFVVLPQIFAAMNGGRFIGFLFFALIVFSALTSVISLIEVVTQYKEKQKGMSRTKATLIYGSLIFIVAIFVSLSQREVNPFSLFGFDIFTYLDEVANNIMLPITGLFACIAVGWVLKSKTVFSELAEQNSAFKGQKLWLFLLRFVTPILIVIVFVMGIVGNWTSYSKGGLNYGFVLLGASILFIVAICWNIWQEMPIAMKAKLHFVAEEGLEEDDDQLEGTFDTASIEEIVEYNQKVIEDKPLEGLVEPIDDKQQKDKE